MFGDFFKPIAAGQPGPKRLALNFGHCLLLMLAGETVYTFGTYGTALQKKLGYSVTNNQFIYNFGMLGYAVAGFLAGKVVEMGGPQLALSVAAVMSAIGSSVCTMAVYEMFKCPVYIFWAAATLNALGLGFASMLGVSISARNSSRAGRGKAVGTVQTASICAPAVHAVAWRVCAGSDKDVPPNVGAYFLYMAILVQIILWTGVMHVRLWKVVESDDEKTAAAEVKSAPSEPEKASLKALLLPSYLAIFFVYTLFKSVDKTYLGMFGQMEESLGFPTGTKAVHLIIFSLTSGISRLGSGFLIDFVGPRVPAWVYLVVAMLTVMAVDTLLVLAMMFMFKYYVTTIGHALTSFLYVVTPKTCADRLGEHNMEYGWGACVLAGAIGPFAFTWWNGRIYDANIQPPGQETCFGPKCFQLSFIINVCILAVAMVVLLVFGRNGNGNAKSKDNSPIELSAGEKSGA
eukprot:166402_1